MFLRVHGPFGLDSYSNFLSNCGKPRFLPRTPKSLEQLDLLLLPWRKRVECSRMASAFRVSLHGPNASGYVKEEVMIRYDPADLAIIRVFHQESFVCRAICQELSGQTVSLKEIEKARSLRRKQVREGLSTRAAMVDRFVEIHHGPTPEAKNGDGGTSACRSAATTQKVYHD